MKKILVALALVAASAAPAVADYGRQPTATHHQHILSGYGRHAEARRTHTAPDLRQSNDPYWSPCDYTTDTDPNGCL
jgi:hypothetical protein